MTMLLGSRTDRDLPLPVVRWLEVAWPGGLDVVESIRVAGPVRVRRGHLWLHGDCTMRFLLGESYVSDIRLGVGPLTVIRGLDAFVDEVGITVVGHETSTGHEVDQGAFLALWCQSLLFPTAWASLRGLRWTPVDDCEARVALPFRGGTETATVRFDPAVSNFPVAFEADRYKVVGQPKVSWHVEYGEWHWRDGLALPTRMRVTWADEHGPWFEMHADEIVANEPMGDHLARARAAITAATLQER